MSTQVLGVCMYMCRSNSPGIALVPIHKSYHVHPVDIHKHAWVQLSCDFLSNMFSRISLALGGLHVYVLSARAHKRAYACA